MITPKERAQWRSPSSVALSGPQLHGRVQRLLDALAAAEANAERAGIACIEGAAYLVAMSIRAEQAEAERNALAGMLQYDGSCPDVFGLKCVNRPGDACEETPYRIACWLTWASQETQKNGEPTPGGRHEHAV